MRTLALCILLVASTAAAESDTLNREDISMGIDKVRPEIVKCGEKSKTKGTVKIQATVGKGVVTSVVVKATPDAALGACVANAVRTATFRATAQSTSFLYPFVF
jgi:hypothetical protein